MPTLAERRGDAFVLLQCSGRITIDGGVADFREKVDDVISRGGKNVVVDLARVTYIDSMGIGELADAYRRLKDLDGTLKMVSVSSPIRDLLRIVRLDTVFEIYRDVDEAVSTLAD